MKRKFTILTAALALLACLTIPLGMMGQTRESYTATYDVTDLGDMFEDGSSYASANGYWKVPASAGESALINIPITEQPTSSISLTFHIATFGNGTNPDANNTTITAVGTESNSNWSGSGVSSYPSSSTYVDGVMTITMPENPTTLSGLEITMGVDLGVKIFRLQSITVEYTYGGGTPTPTTYTVTYDCNGGTSGCPENVTGIEAGTTITLADAPSKTDNDFAGWSDGSNIYEVGDEYEVNGNVTFTAQWTPTGGGGANEPAVTLVFTSNDCWGFPTSKTEGENTYTCGDYTITLKGSSGNGYYYFANGHSLLNGKSGAYLQLPAFTFDVERIVVEGASGASSSVKQNIFVGTTAVSTETTGATGTNTYIIDDNYQNAGNVYTLKITSAHNTQITKIEVYAKDTNVPSISASNVDLAFSATSGSIAYTINNEPDPAGILTAEVPQNSWLTLGTINTTAVPFTCSANPNATDRTETVTLTYTYNGETVTKDVTVTQAGNPNVFNNISEINASGVSYKVRGTVLATSNNGFVIGDNTGYVYTYKSTNLAVGNKVILEGTTGTYGHVIQFTDAVTITNTDASNYDGQPAVQTITEVPDYTSGLYLSTYFQYVGSLSKTTVNNKTLYLVAVGESSICISYPSTDQTTTLEGLLSKTVHVKGYFSGINSSGYFTTIMESIEEVPTPSVTVTPSTIEAPYEGADGTLSLTYENITEFYSFDFYFCDANGDELDVDPDWIDAEINEENDTYTLDYLIDPNNGEARTAYMKVYTFDDEEEEVFAIVTVTQAAAPEPSITVTPATVSEDAEEHEGTLALTYVNLEISNMTDFVVQYYDENDTPLASDYDPEWIEVLVAEQDPQIGEGYVVSYFMLENEGSAHTVYFRVYALGTVDYVYSNLVTITQAAPVVPPTPGTWVLTDLADLTEDDVFVIVGDNGDTYAMSNDNGASAAPVAVAVTVVEGTLSAEPAANLQWNISITEDGYTFYPNGETETWLYCINNNNGVRVGTGDAKHFTLDEGYLTTTETTDQRYIGIYNSQDWRCYKLGTDETFPANIANQTFSFYKKVEPTPAGIPLEIEPGQWYLIASPVGTISPEIVGNMTPENAFALYSFDQNGDSEGKEWLNYKNSDNGGFSLEEGKGYLYAHSGDNTVALTFTGTPNQYDINNNILPLIYNPDANLPGYNLLGNPFNETVYISGWPHYIMQNGSIIESQDGIAPMQGFFVIAEDDDQSVNLSNEPTEKGASVALNVSRNRGNVIDRARVCFDESRQLPKFQLFEGSTKVYIPQGDQDYAVVRSEGQGELPVNFSASENGTYTLSMDVENMDMNYLHLIDNMTGMDVDLLQTPSYTFEAKVNDYESRFRLVFAANNEDGVSTGSTAFAFYSNGSWIINNAGEATLQVVDLTGRILSSETIHGSVSTTINAVPGVYMLRLINGENVNVQKIVVR